MNQYKRYETIKKYLNEITTTINYDALREHFKDVMNERDVEAIINEMKEDNSIYMIDEIIFPVDNKKYAIATFRAVRETFGFAEIMDDSFYIASQHFNGALDGDTVLVEIHDAKERFGEIRHIIKRNREVLLGTIKKKGTKLIFVPYDTKVLYPVEADFTSMKVKPNDRVIGKITAITDVIHVRITDILGQADTPGMDVLSVLFVYGIDADFDADVLEEANEIPETISERECQGRRDHRDQYVITIDGEDAKDLDDAIYMESLNGGYRLYVHIADVSHYVKQGSALNRSAYDRSSSVYMVDRVVPMLPQKLSNGVCSLHPHVDRLTLTCQIDIAFSGEIIDYNIYPSIIQSHRRMSYTEVNAGTDLGEVTEMLHMMQECASRLQYKRDQAGQIDFDTKESQFVVDNQGHVLDIFIRERGDAEMMIESFMVLANEVVAEYCRYQSMPILYRVHEAPEREKMQDLSHTLRILGYRMRGDLSEVKPKTIKKALEFFEGKPEYPVISKLTLRSMTKAKYAPEPLGHFGLALEDYTHFTSPIRRYADLYLHQCLKQYAFKHDFRNLEKDEVFAQEAGLHVSRKERSILDAERQVEKIKKAQFMVDKVGEIYTGYISGVANFGIFIELANTVEGVIHVRDLKDDYYTFNGPSQTLLGERTGKSYKLGQKMKVKVVEVDLVENSVHFAIVETKSNSNQKRKTLRNRSQKDNKSERSRKLRKERKSTNERRHKKS